MRIVVVGGGIAGLAAARRLETLVPDAEIVLVEKEERLGGKIRTEHVGELVIEAAPDSFLSRKERGIGLCEELGLADELVGRRPEHAGTFVRRGRKLLPLPSGLTGMVPTDLDALAESELLSAEGRERLGAEVDVPPTQEAGDESIADFVSRRLGREAYESIVEPLTTGIYGGDGEQLSLRATFPMLRALELEHGSVLRGLAAQAPAAAGGYPPFVSLRNGMATLVERLAASLERTRIVLGRTVARVDGYGGGYAVPLSDGELLAADGVVLAVPAFAVSLPRAGPGPRAGGRARRDPVLVVGRRHARVSRGRSRLSARGLRLRSSARRGIGRARVHMDVEQVGGARSRGRSARARVHGPFRARRHHRALRTRSSSGSRGPSSPSSGSSPSRG